MRTAKRDAGRSVGADRGTARQSNIYAHSTALAALVARLIGLHALAAWIEARRPR